MHTTSEPSFRHILTAPARAVAARQLLIMALFLCAATSVHALAAYIAHALSGHSLGLLFDVYGFLPSIDWDNLTRSAKLVMAAGFALALYLGLVGMTAVAACQVEELRGNRFLRFSEALRIARDRARQLFFGQAILLLFLLFVIIVLGVFGLIGRIPYVGDWLYGLLYIVPTYLLAFLAILVVIVLQASWLLMPAVAACDRKGETFAIVIETFSTLFRRPLQWLGYTGYSVVAAKLTSFVYAYLAYRAVQLAVWGVGLTDGGKLNRLTRQALDHLPVDSDIVAQICNLFPGIEFGFDLTHFARAAGENPASYLIALMLFLIFVSVVAYGFATLIAGQVYAYMVIRYQKDRYRIDKEKPLYSYEPYPEGISSEGDGDVGGDVDGEVDRDVDRDESS